MARFSIISKDNSSVTRYTGAPVYHGTHLKPGYIEFREIASPTLIPWQIGDYVDYTRTGFRYKLYSIPQPTKQAVASAAGDSFVYRDVQLFCATKDLEICPFRDLVVSDNTIHFTTLQNISTYENVYGIADRIQANLDSFYGDGVWDVQVIDTADAGLLATLSETKEFSLSDGNIISALDLIYSQWNGIGWIYSLENGVNTITIGRPNVQDAENTTSVFAYGKGNGVTVIKKEQSGKNDLATRLYAYGSTRNLIARYYNNLTPAIKDAQSVYIPNLMIPTTYWGQTDMKRDARKAYLEADASSLAKYGLRPKTIYFDGSGDYEEIYPSIEGMTIGEIRSAMSSSDTYYPSNSYSSSARVDEVVSAVNPSDDGVLSDDDGGKYIQIVSLPGVSREGAYTFNPGQESAKIPLTNITVANNITATGKVLVTPAFSATITSGANLGALSVRLWIEIAGVKYGNAAATYSRSGNVYTVTMDPFEIITETTGSAILTGYIFAAPTNKDTSFNLSYAITMGTTTLEVAVAPSETFTINTRQLGFDISKQQSAVSGGLCTIAFKSGWCAGREFTVKKCEYVSSGDQWKLTIVRQNDESIGQYFPNSVYQIAAGDRFVLIDLTMPEIYISAAQERLYDRAAEVLESLSAPKYVYEPEIDAKVLAASPETIMEGMYMPLRDADVVDEVVTIDGQSVHQEWVLIDSIEIDEGAEAIPTYKITLQDEKRESFLSRITKAAGRNTRDISDIVLTDLRTNAEELTPDLSADEVISVTVEASSSFIGYENSFNDDPINEVVLVCKTTGIDAPTFQWYYNGESGWTAISGATGETYTVDPDSTAYYQDDNITADFRCVVSANSDYAGEVTVVKMLMHTLNISLSSDSHIFQAGPRYAVAAEDKTSIICYLGVDRAPTRVDVTNIKFYDTDMTPMAVVYAGTRLADVDEELLVDADGRYLVIGAGADASMVDTDGHVLLTVTVVNNGTTSAYLRIQTTTYLDEPTGVIEIPVVVREADVSAGITERVVNLYYSWALALQGNSAFKSIVFKRSDNQPSTPTGGSYASPVPSGWSDGVPSGTKTLWMSMRTFSANGEYPQDSAWTTPTVASDTADMDLEFSALATNPGTPDSPASGANWHDTATPADVWMAICYKTAGEWGNWEVLKVKGEKGDDGTSVLAQYSVNGTSNWHSTYSANDVYMRTSSDGGTTWGDAIRIVGEDGAPGPYTDYSFAYSPNLTSEQSDGCPTDTGTDGSEGSKITTWYDAPPTAVSGQYLWMRVISYTLSGDTLVAGTPSYARIGGEEGADGQDGEDGQDGADGANGYSAATVYLYQRSISGTSNISVPSNDYVYRFADGKIYATSDTSFTTPLTTIETNWHTEIPDGDDPCYVTMAFVQENTATAELLGGLVSDDGSWSPIARLTGKNGLAGKIMRGINEFSNDGLVDGRPDGYGGYVAGYQGLEETDPEIIYYDVVYRIVNGVRTYYYCKNGDGAEGHTPGSGTNWQNYWEEATNFNFIATKVLLASNAFIDIFTGNAAYMMDDNGTVVVSGMQGGSSTINGNPKVNFFAGTDSTHTDPQGAPFRVAYDGSVYASDITIDGGSISIKDNNVEKFKVTSSGAMTATDATILGSVEAQGNNFDVGNGTKVAIKSNNGLYVSSGPCYVHDTLYVDGIQSESVGNTALSWMRSRRVDGGTINAEVDVNAASYTTHLLASNGTHTAEVFLYGSTGDVALKRDSNTAEDILSSPDIKRIEVCTSANYPSSPDANTLYIIIAG